MPGARPTRGWQDSPAGWPVPKQHVPGRELRIHAFLRTQRWDLAPQDDAEGRLGGGPHQPISRLGRKVSGGKPAALQRFCQAPGSQPTAPGPPRPPLRPRPTPRTLPRAPQAPGRRPQTPARAPAPSPEPRGPQRQPPTLTSQGPANLGPRLALTPGPRDTPQPPTRGPVAPFATSTCGSAGRLPGAPGTRPRARGLRDYSAHKAARRARGCGVGGSVPLNAP